MTRQEYTDKRHTSQQSMGFVLRVLTATEEQRDVLIGDSTPLVSGVHASQTA